MKRLLLITALAVNAWGAASLALGTCATDTAGRVVTCTVSGAGFTAPLSPSTGVTNMGVFLGVVVASSSVTTSGSTVTFNLAGFIVSGDTVTLNATAASNLTDAAANTLVGQSGTTVTNNSTVTGLAVAATNTNLYFLGQWATAGYVQGTFGRLDFAFTGTNAEIEWNNNGGSNVSVDGGSFAALPCNTYNTAGDCWGPVSATDLADTIHTVRLYLTYLHTGNSIKIKGSAPAISTPANYGTLYKYSDAGFANFGRIDGCPNVKSYNYAATPVWAGGSGNTDGGIRFVAQTSAIGVWIYEAGDGVALYRDGVQVGSSTVSGTANTWDLHLFTGLDNSQPHVWTTQWTQNTGGASLYQLMVAGGISAVAQPAYKCVGEYGDSITAGIAVTDGRQTAMWQATQQYRTSDNRQGTGGATVATTLSLLANTAAITGMSPTAPVIYITQGGTNDMNAAVALGTFQTAYQTMLTNIAAGAPAGSLLLAQAILPRSGYTSGAGLTTWNSYNAAIKAAVDAYNSGAPAIQARYYSTLGWWDPTNAAYTADGLHPNAAGYAVMVPFLSPIVQAFANGCNSYAGQAVACNAVQ